MVSGFTKFKERFQGFENQYVIIGGTACDLIMENEELPFRATKDVDIVLIVESITAEFGRQFWEYVKEAGYEHLNKSTGNAQFYRFTSPKSKEYPYMIEIFSRNPDFIILEDDAVLTPLPIDDEISSLSAILLNEAYYELLKTGQMMVDGIPVLSPTCKRLKEPLIFKQRCLRAHWRLKNQTLVAITLMIAESRPEEKDIMVNLVMNFLTM
ncbi:MAG: hypothetical protein ACLR62_13460 [Coprococcus sp.]